MPAVKFFARLDLSQIFRFLDGHYLTAAVAVERLKAMGICRLLHANNDVLYGITMRSQALGGRRPVDEY
jgi:hypothetical protein